VAGRSVTAIALIWLGVGLTLPYYGAEVFGLHAVGQHVLEQNDPAALEPLAHAIRFEAGIWFIVAGLLLLAAGSVLLAVAIWGSGRFSRWSGIPLAAGLLLYLPQFAVAQPLRIAHGLLMLGGCAWLSLELGSSHTARGSVTLGYGLRAAKELGG
jgi:hypothetical protein